MLSKTWKQRKYEIQKYIYVKPRYSLKKKDRKSLLQKSTKFKQVLHKEDFQMINQDIKISQLHWSSEKSKVQEQRCMTTQPLEVKINKMTIASISKDLEKLELLYSAAGGQIVTSQKTVWNYLPKMSIHLLCV